MQRSLGLGRLVATNAAAKLAVQQLMALALLPPQNMVEGLRKVSRFLHHAGAGLKVNAMPILMTT